MDGALLAYIQMPQARAAPVSLHDFCLCMFYWSRIMWTSKDRKGKVDFVWYRCAQSMERGEVKQREADIAGESVCTTPASPDKTTEPRVLLYEMMRVCISMESLLSSRSPGTRPVVAHQMVEFQKGSMIPLIASLKPFVRTEWWWSGSIRAATKPQGAAEGRDLRN